MVNITAYIPHGFSNETKGAFIQGVKECMCAAFDCPLHESAVYLINFLPENCCPDFGNKMALNIYMPEGASDDAKDLFAKIYKRLCVNIFGQHALPAFATIEECKPSDLFMFPGAAEA